MVHDTDVVRAAPLQVLPATMFGDHDTAPMALLPRAGLEAQEIVSRLKLDPGLAAAAAERADRGSPDLGRLIRARPALLQDLRRLHSASYGPDESPLHIVGVAPDSAVLSDTPFTLIIDYQNAGQAAVVLAAVQVSWAGEAFVVEAALSGRQREGRAEVAFDRAHGLPVGQAQFDVTLYREDGAASSFTRSVYVLPANPLSLSVGPAGARVTGSWSARGDYQPASDTFLTEIEITLANGDGGAVAMNRRVDWQFWDGPVGSGTLIEASAFDWPGAVNVPAFGVWRGSVWFSSPRGSGIFGVYDRKEDMAISISMTASDGRTVRGEITARVMLSYGVNIIKVGAFGTQEHFDLYDAVDQMRQIYERRDITLRSVGRFIISDALAGGYTVTNSEDEVRDMWEDWSVPNDSVDVYVVQDFDWSSFNGFAGGIPGPAAKGGRTDGVAVEKTGFIDGSGTQRLNVAILAQLIGHEVGHYLGLEHLEDSNNLMRSNTGLRGPDLNYAQYRTMFPHGFMHYE